MKLKSLIALVMLSTLLLSFSMQGLADKATSSVKDKSLAEETPHTTNEAEYAEFVKKEKELAKPALLNLRDQQNPRHRVPHRLVDLKQNTTRNHPGLLSK